MFENTSKADAVAFYISFAAFVYALLYGAGGWWWALSFAVHVIVITLFSAMVHRYYSHEAFVMNEKLAFALSVIPALYMFPGAITWKVIHTAHHATSDTPEDTNIRGLGGFFGLGYRHPDKKYIRAAVRLAREQKHLTLHKYHILFVAVYGLILFAISPTLFLYGFAVPMFTNHCGNRIHKQFAHSDSKPLNLWFMEYIIPQGGEWIHSGHHDEAKGAQYATKWYELDTGGLFIKYIMR